MKIVKSINKHQNVDDKKPAQALGLTHAGYCILKTYFFTDASVVIFTVILSPTFGRLYFLFNINKLG